MLTGSTGSSTSATGKTELEAGLPERYILPDLAVRCIVVDRPASVYHKTELICLLYAHLILRYLDASATAERECDIVSVIFIGAVQAPA